MIYAFTGQKGGVGKTTCAIVAASEWLRRGRKVLLVDADPQGSARTWGDVAAEGKHAAPTIVAMGVGMHRPDQLPALASSYDITVIDSPPRHGEIQRAALMVADVAILPCGPAALDAWALTESLAVVNEALTLRPQLKAAVLITRKMARTAIGAGARESLAECGLPVLESELAYRTVYQEAPAAGLGVTVYAPTSSAADEVRSFVDELERFAKPESKGLRRVKG